MEEIKLLLNNVYFLINNYKLKIKRVSKLGSKPRGP